MKHIKYLFLFLLFAAAGSCSKDSTSTVDPVTPDAARDALLNSTQIGVYQDGKQVFAFDKEQHQLYINPSQYIFRILNDTGAKYVELRLSQPPTSGNPAKTTLIDKFDLNLTSPGPVILLKSDDQHLWLWSQETHTGYIVPWVAE